MDAEEQRNGSQVIIGESASCADGPSVLKRPVPAIASAQPQQSCSHCCGAATSSDSTASQPPHFPKHPLCRFFSATYNKPPNVNLLSTSAHRPPPKEHPRPDRTAGYRISRRCFLYCFPFLGGDIARRFGRVRSAGQVVTNARDARLRSTGPTSYSANAVRLSPNGRKQTSGLR